jgi:Lon protease-like protein
MINSTYSYLVANEELIPIFPLSAVLIPGMSFPLHIFESRYRQLVSDLLAMPEPERKFGVVAIKAGWEVNNDKLPLLYQVGTMANLRKVKHLPDGKFDIQTTGADRFEILDIYTDRAPYLMAKVLPLPAVVSDQTDPLITQAQQAYLNYLQTLGETTEATYVQLPTQASALANLLISTLSGNLIEQQLLLEMNSVSEKLYKLIQIFRRESILLETIPSIPAPYLIGAEISLN